MTNLCDQFLLGDSVLVAPVYRPDTDHRAVYLPVGEWIDYWTGDKLKGGRYILAECPLETMPIYMKAGAIVPEGPLLHHADEQADETVTFHIYGAEACEGSKVDYSLYEDDGISFDYQDQAYSRLNVSLTGKGDTLELSYTYAHKQYEANRNLLVFRLHHLVFNVSGVEGLNVLNPDQLQEGMEGWLLDEQSGDLIIQSFDRPAGANWVITAAD
ncbi:DUF5110 domain-containing protein [Paenibacillus mangrovi]|uniref:DUF5110 domain-containing protein n=1 Tax=Paenibacillus mangrovi TaxID=2931978 RepID=UPI0031400B88